MTFLIAAQAMLGARVLWRFLQTARGVRVQKVSQAHSDKVSVLLPVLDEADRITYSLESLIAQPEEVFEILVVDGGSTDGTQSLVQRFAARDPRVRIIDASPVPDSWTGKAWGLNVGFESTDPSCEWILCLDADVRPAPELTRSLLSHARRTGVTVFSLATCQRLSDKLDALFHPAMLTTLIYRFGKPGRTASSPARVQANGQCFFARRDVLRATQAFRAAQASLCEDITTARAIAAASIPVGFYESDRLVETSMYSTWRDTWRNWPRSLPMRDQYFGWNSALGLAEVALVQALPIPLLFASLYAGAAPWVVTINGVLVLVRLGVLVGLRHIYPQRPWTYWFSPLLDVPVTAKIVASALRRKHSWRGRYYIRKGGNRFYLLRN